MNNTSLSDGASRAASVALRRIALFRDLDDDVLSDLTGHTRGRSYARGELLSMDAEARDTIFVVVRGGVRVSCLSSDGREIILSTLHNEDIFTVREDDLARALHDGTLIYRIPYRILTHHLTRRPQSARALLDLCFRQHERDRQRMIDLALGPIPTRLARVLVRLAEASAERMVLLTHQELADVIGTRPHEVTRTLRTFRERGLVTFQPHQRGIRVCDLAALADL